MATNTIIAQVEQNIEQVLQGATPEAVKLWEELLDQHPADIALLISNLHEQDQRSILIKLPPKIATLVFEYLSHDLQAALLTQLDPEQTTDVLKNMPVDELTDLFDYFPDEQVKKYLNMLQKRIRKQVISLLDFDPKSAGGIMNSEVITLPLDITVQKSISLLQRVQPHREHLSRIYITDKEHILRGYINLEDLIINRPETPLKYIIKKIDLVFKVSDDQEEVAQKMRHYGELTAPVIDNEGHFLGIITADDILEVIEEEASEDVYRMSGITPVEHSYFQTPFWKLIWQRSPWLIGLLLLQSISSLIMHSYQTFLDRNIVLSFFLTMLIGTGGNAGNQSGALVIRGLTTGEMGLKNAFKILFREFKISMVMAFVLSVIGFARVLVTPEITLLTAFAISASLFIIIIASMLLGTFLPLLFEWFNIDPAYSAAPFLATVMDILGILIYCIIASCILG